MDERFAFGKNWERYITAHFSQERVEISRCHILRFLGCADLQGTSFLDIGCGSGIHSLAAWQSGAASVVSFDFDDRCVQATRTLINYAGQPRNWKVLRGSVLDEAFMQSLPKFDIVYSWGVLHHTGDVWKAIRLAATTVKGGGLFYVALYSANVQKPPTSPEFWLKIKLDYLRGSWLRKRLMETWYIWRFRLNRKIGEIPRFTRYCREYKRNRGMNVMTDIRDWLGGWPMEFCYDEDVKRLAEDELEMDVIRIVSGEANTEFLFRRKS